MTITRKQRFDVFNRDNFTCRYCGRKTPEVILELDHIIPISKGGLNEPDNLITSCFECNRGKGKTLLDTVLLDKDIHDQTILMAEKEMQLNEYNYLRNKIRLRENEEIEELTRYFTAKFPEPEYEHAKRECPSAIIRQCLKLISYIDIFDSIDTAFDITLRDTKGDSHVVATAKYLTGILKNELRNRNNISLSKKNPVE
jgi:hypothetical protein